MIPEYCISIILNRMTHVRVDDALFIWDFGMRPNSAGAHKLKLLYLTSHFLKNDRFSVLTRARNTTISKKDSTEVEGFIF